MDHSQELTHLSLCTGYGGLDLGLKRAINSVRTIAYVEIEAFQCANLVSKMEKGWLDAAPIWTNLKTFPWKSFRGKVDILSGGFPCQPFSSAGKRAGDEDPRHLWPHIKRGIEIVRPSIVFMENVQGIINSKLQSDQWHDQKAHQFCFISLESWKDWVTKQRRGYSQRLKWACLTIEEGCSYWGTPTAGSVPFSSKVNYYLKRVSKKKQLDLNGETLLQALKDKSNLTLNHQEEALLGNPRWVDCLMGLPIGWSCPSSIQLVRVGQTNLEALEMELCHKPPPKLLKSYQSDFLDKAIPDYIKMVERGDLPNINKDVEESARQYALDEFSNYVYPFIDVANHD